jgi:hypothetical protein
MRRIRSFIPTVSMLGRDIRLWFTHRCTQFEQHRIIIEILENYLS